LGAEDLDLGDGIECEPFRLVNGYVECRIDEEVARADAMDFPPRLLLQVPTERTHLPRAFPSIRWAVLESNRRPLRFRTRQDLHFSLGDLDCVSIHILNRKVLCPSFVISRAVRIQADVVFTIAITVVARILVPPDLPRALALDAGKTRPA